MKKLLVNVYDKHCKINYQSTEKATREMLIFCFDHGKSISLFKESVPLLLQVVKRSSAMFKS